MGEVDRWNTFVCPECGGTQAAAHLRAIPSSLDTSPWGQIHGREVCASCRRVVPTTLAERWQGETLNEVREAWRLLFRENPQSGPLSAELWNRLVDEPVADAGPGSVLSSGDS